MLHRRFAFSDRHIKLILHLHPSEGFQVFLVGKMQSIPRWLGVQAQLLLPGRIRDRLHTILSNYSQSLDEDGSSCSLLNIFRKVMDLNWWMRKGCGLSWSGISSQSLQELFKDDSWWVIAFIISIVCQEKLPASWQGRKNRQASSNSIKMQSVFSISCQIVKYCSAVAPDCNSTCHEFVF